MIPEDVIAEILRRTDIVAADRGVPPTQGGGADAQGPVPLSYGEDPVVRGESRAADLSLLRLRGRGRRHHVSREARAPRAFMEAVRFLAERAGVTSPGAAGGPGARRGRRPPAPAGDPPLGAPALPRESARGRGGVRPRHTLAGRGLTPDAGRAVRVGVCPAAVGWRCCAS